MNKPHSKKTLSILTALAVLLSLAALPTASPLVAASLERAASPVQQTDLARRIILYKDGPGSPPADESETVSDA